MPSPFSISFLKNKKRVVATRLVATPRSINEEPYRPDLDQGKVLSGVVDDPVKLNLNTRNPIAIMLRAVRVQAKKVLSLAMCSCNLSLNGKRFCCSFSFNRIHSEIFLLVCLVFIIEGDLCVVKWPDRVKS